MIRVYNTFRKLNNTYFLMLLLFHHLIFLDRHIQTHQLLILMCLYYFLYCLNMHRNRKTKEENIHISTSFFQESANTHKQGYKSVAFSRCCFVVRFVKFVLILNTLLQFRCKIKKNV